MRLLTPTPNASTSLCAGDFRIAPILRLRETCHHLKAVASSERLWEQMCWQHFKVQRSTAESVLQGSWYSTYMETSLLQVKVKKSAGASARDQRLQDRRAIAFWDSAAARGTTVEGVIAGLGTVRVSVEGTIWDTGEGGASDDAPAAPSVPESVS